MIYRLKVKINNKRKQTNQNHSKTRCIAAAAVAETAVWAAAAAMTFLGIVPQSNTYTQTFIHIPIFNAAGEQKDRAQTDSERIHMPETSEERGRKINKKITI